MRLLGSESYRKDSFLCGSDPRKALWCLRAREREMRRSVKVVAVLGAMALGSGFGAGLEADAATAPHCQAAIVAFEDGSWMPSPKYGLTYWDGKGHKFVSKWSVRTNGWRPMSHGRTCTVVVRTK